MFGRSRRDEARLAANRQKQLEREAYERYCLERAPYLIEIARAILRAAKVTEPEYYDQAIR